MWKVSEFGSLIGVSPSTLRRWETEGKLIPERTLGNQSIYTDNHLKLARHLQAGKLPTRVIVYCRVSSHAQRNDLISQVEAMDKFCVSNGVIVSDRIQEIGGGLNFKRRKFRSIIQWAMQGEVKAVYVAHKDRLCRFGFDLVEQIINWGGGTVIVANSEA
jgi:predicted site-specific integrase-resolvase